MDPCKETITVPVASPQGASRNSFPGMTDIEETLPAPNLFNFCVLCPHVDVGWAVFVQFYCIPRQMKLGKGCYEIKLFSTEFVPDKLDCSPSKNKKKTNHLVYNQTNQPTQNKQKIKTNKYKAPKCYSNNRPMETKISLLKICKF